MINMEKEKEDYKNMVDLTESNPTASPTISDLEKILFKPEKDSESLFVDKRTALVQYEKHGYLKARVRDYIDLFNKRFVKEKDVDYECLYDDLSWKRQSTINMLEKEGRWTVDESLLSELRQSPLHKQIIEYYKEYQLDYFEVRDIQNSSNYFDKSLIKYLKPAEVQEQLKKDILQCSFERGDSPVIRKTKEKMLKVLEVFDKIKL